MNDELKAQLSRLIQLLEQNQPHSHGHGCSCQQCCACPTSDVLEQSAFRFNEMANANAAQSLAISQQQSSAQFAQLLEITREVTGPRTA